MQYTQEHTYTTHRLILWVHAQHNVWYTVSSTECIACVMGHMMPYKPGLSTLITSAPKSPNSIVVKGPASILNTTRDEEL